MKKNLPIKTRFWSHVTKGNNNDCWEWFGAHDHFGYGHLKILGKLVSSHRLSWVLHKGKIPLNMCVLHRCDNPKCINPDHLFLGTKKDNNLDKETKGRANHAFGNRHGRYVSPWDSRGEKNSNAILTKKQVIMVREMAKKGYSIALLSRKLSVSEGCLRNIVKRRTWKHLKN